MSMELNYARAARRVGWLLPVVCTFCLLWLPIPARADDDQPNRIRIEYGAPNNPEQQALYELMMVYRPLEKFQEIFSPFRLPIEVTLRIRNCDGLSNAWYQRPVVTICYEYIEEMRKNRPTTEAPAGDAFTGITSSDAMFGQFFYAVAHEMGHVIFDLLDVPIFGRAEDAADGFAVYMMLELGKRDAQRFILGAAYAYKEYVKNPRVCVPLIAFADAHAAPMQRYYNLMCIGYGAYPELFSGLIEKGYLPKNRADSCRIEYNEVNFAFHTAIAPHLDKRLAEQVLDKTWVPRQPPPSIPAVSLRPDREAFEAYADICTKRE
jgi:hypothetical protein